MTTSQPPARQRQHHPVASIIAASVTALVILAVVLLSIDFGGDGNPDYDPGWCDFYQGLGVFEVDQLCYVKAETQEEIDRYCTR